MKKLVQFLHKPIFQDKRFIFLIWFSFALVAGIKHALRGVFNDYKIFKSVVYHTFEQVNLYLDYPELNGDSNHYGPIFSLIFAPFALLPDSIGTILWDVSMMLVLFIAIYYLPIKWIGKVIIYYISLQALYANVVNSETNGFIAALIIGSFIMIRKEKDFWAACFIALGTFIKLYGIVGFAFFFFSKHKTKLVGYFFFWSIIFFIAPMIISSPSFVIQSYFDWYTSLVEKNLENVLSINQDISVMGMYRRIFDDHTISNFVFLVPGLILFGLQYLRVKEYGNLVYQLSILISTLLFVVLFSTGSESCTYIIAVSGAAIWFILQPRPYSRYVIFLLIFLLLIELLASGLTPTVIRKGFIKKYALEALPFFMIWIDLAYKIITGKINHFSTSLLEDDSI